MNLPKRSEIKSKYRPEISESYPERELNFHLLRLGIRCERQFPIGNYFVDLALPQYSLAIEYDGKYHLDNQVYDFKRDQEIRKMGWSIFRIMNKGGGIYQIDLDGKDIFEYLGGEVGDIFRCSNFFERIAKIIKKIIDLKERGAGGDDWVVKFSSGQLEIDKANEWSGGFVSVQEIIKQKYENNKR